MRTRMRFTACVAGTVLVGVAQVSEADTISLVQDGTPVATIVLPAETEWDRYEAAKPEDVEAMAKKRFPKASPGKLAEVIEKLPKLIKKEAKRVGDDEELAVEELVSFIEKMSGAKLPVVRMENGQDLPDGPLVVLGTEQARQAQLGKVLDGLKPDGFTITRRGERLFLAGRRARGTLYAAYELLERLGCRWVIPGPFGEIFPAQKNLEFTGDAITQNPSHVQRYWWCTWGSGKEYPRWTLRNKSNFVRALGDTMVRQGHASQVPLNYGAKQEDLRVSVRKMVREYKRDENRKIMRDKNGKALRVMVEKDVWQLPDEYYTMKAGKPNTHVPNMSNPKVWDLCAEYYRHEFYQRPLEDYTSLSAADGLILDDRKESRLLDSLEFDWTLGAYSCTDRMWFFHRRYIDRVLEEHPDRKFGLLVYANNLTPPRLETVHPAMALVYAPLGICPLHHVRDEKCKTNRAYRKWFEAWQAQAEAVGAESHYYDYLPIGFQWCNFILSPQWAIVGRNYPWFHELGLDGHTTQGFDDWGAMGLTAWVAVRLYWDIDQDYGDIVRDYCRIRFGEQAADAMHRYYKVYEDRMDVVPDLCSNEIWGNHLAIDGATRAAGRAALAEAASLVRGKREATQLKTVVAFQTAMDAWCDGIEHARETGDFGAAIKLMEPAFDIAEKLNGLYSHFVHPKRVDKSQMTRYRPGGWYNKYRIWDERIRGSAASLCLPRNMKVALDTDNTGWTRDWHKPKGDVSALEDWDTTTVPDVKYGTQRDVSAFFYRTDVKVPNTFKGKKKIVLYFPSLIARALRVWINGESVLFDFDGYKDEIWRGPAYFWVDYVHTQEYDVTSLIKPGQKNTIAFRVFKAADHGGTYDRVFLLADPPEEE